jgi:hypothetical protein
MGELRVVKSADQRPLERLLSENEAVEVLGLGGRPNPRGALRWLMRTGKLAYVRLARGIYGFRREDLAALIDAGRVEAAATARKNVVDT